MSLMIVADSHGDATPANRAAFSLHNEPNVHVIMLGDYFDSYNKTAEEQFKNFGFIMDLKKTFPDRLTVLIGNHDMAYLNGDMHVSGHQRFIHRDIREALEKHLDEMDLAYYQWGWVFTHAGLSMPWVDQFMRTRDVEHRKYDPVEVVKELNKAFHEKRYDLFDFVGPNPYGDNPDEGPLWIRPGSLIANNYKADQVVGHTEIAPGDISSRLQEGHGYKIVLLDSPDRFHSARILGDNPRDIEII